MAFEVFTEAGKKNGDFVSITTSKSFGLSRAFLENNNITKGSKAVLMYDKETARIAIFITDSNVKIGYAVGFSKNPNHGASILCRAFFDTYKIDTSLYSGRYKDYEKLPLSQIGLDKKGEAYVFKLKDSSPKTISSDIDAQIKEFIKKNPSERLTDLGF